MSRTVVKSILAAGMAAGLVFTMSGVALPAGKPKPPVQDPRKQVKPVVLLNQSVILAQGLSPKAALQKAGHILHYTVTTAHYLPKGYQLAIVYVFPFIANLEVPQDTQTFMKLSAVKAHHPRHFVVPTFEVDHQADSPYSYYGAYFTVAKAKAGKRTVTVAEQKYTSPRSGKSVDSIYIYWYDTKTRLATEVTADLLASKLTRHDVLKIAGSVS